MKLIDCGDLVLPDGDNAKQDKLFHAIRDKIVHQLWPKNAKLPSTRKLSEELKLSRNTVISSYEQLVAEGYIESKVGSGFYVSVELPDHYLPSGSSNKQKHSPTHHSKINGAFAPGVPDLKQFPLAKWQRYISLHADRKSLLGNQQIQGSIELRNALTDYLATSRSVSATANRIIVTSGAQQALSIALMATLKPQDSVLMENPGYTQMRKVIDLLNYQFIPVPVNESDGLDLPSLLSSSANALYVTPSNQYPMGKTLNTEQRLKLIEWADTNSSWIIEDDYDSEFQFAHRPYTSLQGLSAQINQDSNVIYVGSFSKVMFNSLRLGYLVVPEKLVDKCLTIKDALSGDSPAHIQAALADFIIEGDLVRHIRKMRRLYKEKYYQIAQSVKHYFKQDVEIISQPAGLHITLKWLHGVDEVTLSQRASDQGLIVRPLSYYEHESTGTRHWQSVVLGFGNTNINDIDPLIKRLSQLLYS